MPTRLPGAPGTQTMTQPMGRIPSGDAPGPQRGASGGRRPERPRSSHRPMAAIAAPVTAQKADPRMNVPGSTRRPCRHQTAPAKKTSTPRTRRATLPTGIPPVRGAPGARLQAARRRVRPQPLTGKGGLRNCRGRSDGGGPGRTRRRQRRMGRGAAWQHGRRGASIPSVAVRPAGGNWRRGRPTARFGTVRSPRAWGATAPCLEDSGAATAASRDGASGRRGAGTTGLPLPAATR